MTCLDDKEFTEMWNYEFSRLIIARNTVIENGCKPLDNSINSGMADYCELMILKAKELYYSGGETLMSDLNYDKLEDRLRMLRPDSEVLEKVGT